MNFHILTLFPEMVEQGLRTSIIGRALEKEIISLQAVDIRDHTIDKHGKVDDYTYGGGAGMLMQAQPVFDAWKALAEQTGKAHPRTIYVTPQGHPFHQQMAMELAQEEDLVFLCGHYEGIDERVLEEVVTDYVSIGDYVLTGGELPAMVMIDAIARLVPGVLNNEVSAETESFHNDLLEYPQYSRPEEWHGKKVPAVLLTGDHRKIMQWRLEQSKERTRIRRPDLYAKYQQKEALIKKFSKRKRDNIHIIECLRRGNGEILYAEGDNLLIRLHQGSTCILLAEDEEMCRRLFAKMPVIPENLMVSQAMVKEVCCRELGYEELMECYQMCYTQKTHLKVPHKDIRRLTVDELPYVVEHYHIGDEEYVCGRIRAGEMFGAYVDGQLAGFIGLHDDGSLGMLYVDEAFRRRGLAQSLEAYLINWQMDQGNISYDQIVVGNEASMKLQERMGLLRSENTMWWLEKKDLHSETECDRV